MRIGGKWNGDDVYEEEGPLGKERYVMEVWGMSLFEIGGKERGCYQAMKEFTLDK